MIKIILLLSSLLLAGFLGYRFRRLKEKRLRRYPVSLSRHYFAGLNFLLNEETDKAVDVFIKMLAVDNETIETHLAVGKLFRRRGEVDRAIRIHQHLMTRPRLTRRLREHAMFELGQDYLSAGMLDRAEQIFIELTQSHSYVKAALKTLIDIYQREKDWEKALTRAIQYEKESKQPMQTIIAHFYCELALLAFHRGHLEQALSSLKAAKEKDEQCMRAYLLQAKINIHQQHYQAALENLQKISQEPFVHSAELIDLLTVCYEHLGLSEQLITDFQKRLAKHPEVSVAAVLAHHIQKLKGNKVALLFVADYVRHHPSLRGLFLLVNFYTLTAEDRAKADLAILQNLITTILSSKPNYQCQTCGFASHTSHWQCPKCRAWDTIGVNKV